MSRSEILFRPAVSRYGKHAVYRSLMRILLTGTVVCLFVLFYPGQAFPQEFLPGNDRSAEYDLDDTTGDGITVATVGNTRITSREFILNYTFGPAFTRRQPDSKMTYLGFMVNEKLLGLQGAGQHLDTCADVRQLLAEIQGDCATEELYKDDVRSRVTVTEPMIRSAMDGEKTSYEVRWIYSPARSDADGYFHLIRSGASFDSLFRLQLTGGVTADTRSMTVTRFRLGIQNPVLAHVIDTLPVHHVSAPIETPDGVYLVSVDNRWHDVLTTESEDIKLHHDVERVLADHQSDSISDQYVRTLLEGAKPVIIRRNFDLLEVYLARIAVPPEKSAGWDLGGRLVRRWGPITDSTLDHERSETLVETAGARFTIEDFLWWYRARETAVKFNTSSPQAFFGSLERLVFRMVRDRLLTARALARGYQNRMVVKKQMQWWRDKVLYERVRAGIADSIRLDDSLVLGYYTAHRMDFRNDSGSVRPFEDVINIVKEQYFTSELTKRLLHRILALKESISVSINEPELANVRVDAGPEPRAVDVIAVKTRGIFLRPAFPSIDPKWQAWQ